MDIMKTLEDNDDNIRNVVFRFLIIISIYGVTFFLSIALMVYLVNGLATATGFLYGGGALHMKLVLAFNTLKAFFLFWQSRVGFFDFTSVQYFTLKFLFSLIAPFATVSFLLYYFKDNFLAATDFFKAPPEDFSSKIYGDAHWATEKEVEKAGLFKKDGVLLGRFNAKKLLVADGFQHILLFAPTGSGKGVGFAIPNLLFWKESAIVHDIKLENYELCSGYRHEVLKQKNYLWNPADSDGLSHCYNPLDWISKKAGQMVDDIQKITSFLLPKQDFWESEARSFLVGIMLYLAIDDKKILSLGEVVRTLRGDDLVYNLAVVLDTMGDKIHPIGYMNIAAFLQKAEKERSGVLSTANSSLELWGNPLIDAATATSDFNIGSFKTNPQTLYVGLTPDNIARLQVLMRIFYQQCTAIFTAHMPTPEEKFGVLLLLDEFPTMGKMEQIQNGIAYFRGYKVRLFLIVQDTQQLKGIYEESGMNSFLSNATYRITFAANNVDTANFISNLLGNQTVLVKEQKTITKYINFDPGGDGSEKKTYKQKPLLMPQEIIALPRDDQIVVIEAQPPIRSKKIKYYQEPLFMKRLLKKTFVPTQKPYDLSQLRKKKKDDKNGDANATTSSAQAS